MQQSALTKIVSHLLMRVRIFISRISLCFWARQLVDVRFMTANATVGLCENLPALARAQYFTVRAHGYFGYQKFAIFSVSRKYSIMSLL